MDEIVLTVIVCAMTALGLALSVRSRRGMQARTAIVRERPMLAPHAEAVPETLFAARRR